MPNLDLLRYIPAGVDDGEIIQQASLPILPGDTADSLAACVCIGGCFIMWWVSQLGRGLLP